MRPLPLLLLAILCALPTPSCGARESAPAPGSTRAYDANGRATRAVAARSERPNLIVLTIGALRADAIQLELEGGGDMPSLVRLARESVSFAEASSSAASTLPALASLFTGRAPHRHGVRADHIREPELDSLPTWAEVMRSTLGYQTAAFLSDLPPAQVKPLCAGFESVTDGFDLRQAPALLDAWAATRQTERPFFLFLHSSEAQAPYGEANHPDGGLQASPRARSALESMGPDPSGAELVRRSILDGEQGLLLATDPRLRSHQATLTRHLWAGLETQPDPGLRGSLANAYRVGLHWVDGLLQRTLDHLRARGLLENTLLVVTADHGEAFGEHGMLLHGLQLYDELLRVPLILHGPPPFHQRLQVAGSVGLTDLFPTIVTWLGAPPPDDLEGQSFLDSLRAPGPGRPVLAEESRTHEVTAGLSVAHLVSVRNADWKYIGTLDLTQGTLREEAYDLRSDPLETRNRANADGFVRDLPFDEAFCQAIERARDRLWGTAAYAEWTAQQGYSASTYSSVAGRPLSGCAPER